MGMEEMKGLAKRFVKDESGAGKAPKAPEIPSARRLFHAAALGAGMAGGIIAMSGKKEEPHPPTSQQQQLDKKALDNLIERVEHAPVHGFTKEYFSKKSLACLEDNVYHEARGENIEGQYAVMFATIERALSRRYPDTLCGAVYDPHQFSWTASKKIRSEPINPRTYLKIAIEVHELMRGRTLSEADVAAGLEAGLPHGAIFYKVHNFTGSKKVEEFFAKLQFVKRIGNHDFYMKKEPRHAHEHKHAFRHEHSHKRAHHPHTRRELEARN